MIDSIPRQEIDRLLFNVMAAIYHFEQHKMALFNSILKRFICCFS